jgi:hypothetical protein
MSTYTTAPAAPNLVATLWGPLSEIIGPLLDGPGAPAVTDPGIPELLGALGEALTAAVRVTRGTPGTVAAPVPARATAVRAPAARVTTAQVGSVAGEPKPGSLRARLIDHLAANPGQAFTVTELFHAVGATSGGAVGAALNTMTAHGEAIQTSDTPKRYTAPAGTPAPAPAPAEPPADNDADAADEDQSGTDAADEPDTGGTDQAAPEAEAPADSNTATDETADTPDTDPDTADTEAPDTAPAPMARATRRAKTRR